MERGPESLLIRVMERSVYEDSIGMPEICVYSVLFQLWIGGGFDNPVKVSRSKVMRLSKVRSRTTYHKCIRALCMLGLIDYYPSYQPDGSLVFMREIL